MPVLPESGTPLLPPPGSPLRLTLRNQRIYGETGIVSLEYAIG